MKRDELITLQRGDIILHEPPGSTLEEWLRESYIVSGNYFGTIIAVKTVHITNADEWRLIAKSEFYHGEETDEKETQ